MKSWSVCSLSLFCQLLCTKSQSRVMTEGSPPICSTSWTFLRPCLKALTKLPYHFIVHNVCSINFNDLTMNFWPLSHVIALRKWITSSISQLAVFLIGGGILNTHKPGLNAFVIVGTIAQAPNSASAALQRPNFKTVLTFTKHASYYSKKNCKCELGLTWE